MIHNNKIAWWLPFIFFIVINALALSPTFGLDIQSIYLTLNLPSWAPPSWLFGPVWTFNNILVIYGNYNAINMYLRLKADSNSEIQLIKKLRWFLVIQIFLWMNYIAFQGLSFGTQIPSMYFWPTFSMLIITIISMYFAWEIDTYKTDFGKTVLSGKSIFMSYTSLISWLIIATSLGYFIMMNN